jgi:protocatechuate 3,4-dioxygenase beta subunit
MNQLPHPPPSASWSLGSSGVSPGRRWLTPLVGLVALPALVAASPVGATCPPSAAAAIAGASSPGAAVVALATALDRCPALATTMLGEAALDGLRERSDFHQLVRRTAPRGGEVAMVTPAEPGRRLALEGEVRDREGRPVEDALVYLFQTDAGGVYTRGGQTVGLGEDTPRLFAYLRTDAQGQFAVATIRPGRYPDSRILEHVHVRVEREGRRPLVSELVFADDPELDATERAAVERRGWVVCAPEREAGIERCALPLTVAD